MCLTLENTFGPGLSSYGSLHRLKRFEWAASGDGTRTATYSLPFVCVGCLLRTEQELPVQWNRQRRLFGCVGCRRCRLSCLFFPVCVYIFAPFLWTALHVHRVLVLWAAHGQPSTIHATFQSDVDFERSDGSLGNYAVGGQIVSHRASKQRILGVWHGCLLLAARGGDAILQERGTARAFVRGWFFCRRRLMWDCGLAYRDVEVLGARRGSRQLCVPAALFKCIIFCICLAFFPV